LVATGFTAPSIGSNSLHVKDATGFLAGNLVYIIADGQLEITATIVSINNNFIVFNTTIPAKYTDTNFGRVYRVL
jgi:hypothetical protein